MKKVVFATGNAHKIEEAKAILLPLGYEIISLKDLNLDLDVKETGKTFSENSMIKAKYIFEKTHLPTIADDSGLEIKALNNFPGIFSARFLYDMDYTTKNNYILHMLEDVDNRKARFVCALSYVDENIEKTFLGYIYGTIAHHIIGEGGFGYDPIFYVEKYGTTTGNMPSELKNKISHRYNALKKLGAFLKND